MRVVGRPKFAKRNMFILFLKKLLHVKSPSIMGISKYKYEYDYFKAKYKRGGGGRINVYGISCTRRILG